MLTRKTLRNMTEMRIMRETSGSENRRKFSEINNLQNKILSTERTDSSLGIKKQ